jgi:hypothetical protein
MKNNPAIVVVAYNRLEPLKRLLGSLKRTVVNEGEVRLIISIDNDDNKNKSIADYAESFEWLLGTKEVIYHPSRLGLKNHILKCGNLSEKYGTVILLEDDLYVSPYFLEYTKKAQDYYKNDKNIAGISLYNYRHNEVDKAPFIPFIDNSDVYFIQMAASWGQSWTKEQWSQFYNWYKSNPDLNLIKGLPKEILKWKETSWKKYFISYLIHFNKFFTFPTQSFTTNFNDPGTHYIFHSHYSQSPLMVREKEPSFISFSEAKNLYDVNFEILPQIFKEFNSELSGFDFEVDLYGTKPAHSITKPYILTIKPCKNPIFSYARALKPHEINVFYNLKGEDIHLCRTEDVLQDEQLKTDIVKNFPYFFRNIYDRREMNLFYKYLLKRKIIKISSKLTSIFKR